MDSISDPAVQRVVMMTSAQVGKTEILNNAIGFYMHQDPAPVLLLQPTIDMAEAWSKDRLAPMLRDTPVLRSLVANPRSRDSGNTLLHKCFPGGHITMAGANSPASLASRPIRLMFADEIDRYPSSAGSEGDPVSLAIRRTNNFWNRKTVLVSTPTIAGTSRIEKAYDESDQRRYHVPCPHCGHAQTLRWEQVIWTNSDPATALYHCETCGAGWSDVQRWTAIRGGGWRAARPFRGVAGFHLNELASPWRRLAETVAEFLSAKAGGVEMLKTWKNTALGEVWQEAGEAPEWERLLERREPFSMGVVPRRAVVLTAGIDNQAAPERLEWTLWAWAPGYESWLVDTAQIMGSPASPEVWDEVAGLLARDWPREGGGTMRVARAGADTGGQHTQGVYAQLRRLRDGRIMPLKGVPGWNKAQPVSGPTPVDVSFGGKKIARGLRLWTVAVDVFKAELYRRLWLARTGDGGYPAGWVHLPDGMNVEQIKQLVAEQLVTRKDRRGFPRQEWEKLRANEQLDMCVYARAALSVLGSDRYGERFWARAADAYVVDEAPEPSAPIVPTGAMPTVPPVPAPPKRRSIASRLA